MTDDVIQSEETTISNDVLMANPASEVRLPTIPVYTFVQEAYDLNEWIADDQSPLTNAGLDGEFITDLPNRARMLRQAQSVWMKERYSREEAQREWDERSIEAYDLKDTLEASFRFAFRRHPDLVSKVNAISEGSGHADMVQDLSDLSVLGNAHDNLLSAIGMDMTQLDIAATWADELATLLARVNGERSDDNSAKLLRDKAFTYLKEAVDEIRVTGKFVYRKDQEKLRGFQRTRK
ncbi:MAG: hypothetical protein R8G66_23060 [Cytophagales bacterium]|nr:hypothetical protein [Cytophagales bacterium]